MPIYCRLSSYTVECGGSFTSEILASIGSGDPIAAGRTSAELDRLNNDPPVEAEVAAAKDRMRQSEDGAPGLDGVMAWMLL